MTRHSCCFFYLVPTAEAIRRLWMISRTMLSISLYTIWGGMQVIEGDLDLPLYVLWMLCFSWELSGSRVCGRRANHVDGLPNCENSLVQIFEVVKSFHRKHLPSTLWQMVYVPTNPSREK